MIGWLALVVYVVGYIAAVPAIARAFIKDLVYGTPDEMDYVLAGTLGLLCAFFWPVLWLGCKLGRSIASIAKTPVEK